MTTMLAQGQEVLTRQKGNRLVNNTLEEVLFSFDAI